MMIKTEIVDDRCPICRKRGQMMHSDKLVRQLALHQQWSARKPRAVCADCYGVLIAYRFVVLQDAKEDER